MSPRPVHLSSPRWMGQRVRVPMAASRGWQYAGRGTGILEELDALAHELYVSRRSGTVTGLTFHSNSSAIVRFIKRFDGMANVARAIRATSTPATGSPVGSNRPNCPGTGGWVQEILLVLLLAPLKEMIATHAALSRRPVGGTPGNSHSMEMECVQR